MADREELLALRRMAELEAKAGKPSATPAAPQQPEAPEAMPYAGGVVEAAKAVGSGMAAQSLGGLSGLAGTVLPGPEGQGAKWSENVSSALSYEPKGKTGQLLTKIAGLPGLAISKVADVVGERGSSVPAIGAFGKGSTEALAALIGARSGMRAKPALTPAQAKVAAARDAGFRTTPTEAGAGAVARTAEGLAGEPKLSKAISKENVAVVNETIAGDLGLPQGTALNAETLAGVESQAWKKYEAVRKVGRVKTDAEYAAALDKLEETYKSTATDFPEAAQQLGIKDTQDMVAALRKESFDSSSAMDLIRKLRENANKAYISGDGGYAKVLRGAAKAVEDQIARFVERPQMGSDLSGFGGSSSVVKDFKEARVTLAKVHQARKALAGGENINPQAYAKTLVKSPDLLTGGAREVGEFARDFPRSSQKMPVGSVGAPTWADLVLGGLSGAGSWAAHGGLSPYTAIPAAAAVAARPLTRATLASRFGQALMDPRTNMSSPAAQALGVASIPPPSQEKRQ